MELLHNIIQNPLLRQVHDRRRSELKNIFPDLECCPHKNFLSLQKYISGTPQRFYCRSSYFKYLKWLQNIDQTHRALLQEYCRNSITEINHAFLHLSEINQFDWHDQLDTSDNYELIRFIDQNIHPTYLRLIEAVFSPMLRIPAYFSRLGRGKGTEKLDVYNIVEEIKASDLGELTMPYRHLVRNGIAHGGIKFLDNSICYKDKQGNEETFSDIDIVRVSDELIDICNALLLAFSVFVIATQHHGYEIPNQLLIDELKEETRTPWWEIIGCTPSGYADLNQLIIHVRAKTYDFFKVQVSVFQSGYLAELFAPGYSRYFFSIRSPKSWPGFTVFDGERLRQLRESGCNRVEDYQGVVIENLIFFVPRIKLPLFVNRMETIWSYFRINIPVIAADFRKGIRLPTLTVRDAKIHRNAWGVVLSGAVLIQDLSGDMRTDVRRVLRRIICKSLSYARQQTSRLDFIRYLPLGYARISVYRADHRRRQFSGLGSDLVCTVQVQRIRRIQAPDIYESTIEKRGRYRIAWNRAWLEEINGQPAD
ncbi:hypothetical protein [Trichlorobacter lovleyi]|uniref:hypothetical protein n=1 Tax=Trichlorobacter lovleyi TaxID=313985 RepID=UPI0024810CC4|nr:hypothetical protein [Trichlorobacter lovleyi]